MSKKQLSARVPEAVYAEIIKIEMNTGRKKSDIIGELLAKGLGDAIEQTEESKTAYQVASEQLEYKKLAIKYEHRYKKIVADSAILKHPLFTEIETKGIKLNDKEYKSVVSLFNFLNNVINERD